MAHEQSQIVQNFVPLSLAIPSPNIKDPIDKLVSGDTINNFEKPIIKEIPSVTDVVPSNQPCRKSSPIKSIDRAPIGKEFFYGQTDIDL